MYGIRKIQSKYRDVINQDVVILDEIFGQLLMMNANEDGIIDDYFMTYVRGDIPNMGKCWKHFTSYLIYMTHWTPTSPKKKEENIGF